jgi:hypothetical protein
MFWRNMLPPSSGLLTYAEVDDKVISGSGAVVLVGYEKDSLSEPLKGEMG